MPPPAAGRLGAGAGARALRLLALWGASIAFWAGVVLLMSLRKYVARRIVWPPAFFGRMLHGLAPDYLGYALLTPLVVLVAWRLPVLGRVRRNVLLHLPIGLLFSACVSAVSAAVDPSLYPTRPGVGPPPWPRRFEYVAATHFADDLVVYFAVLLTAVAVSYYRAYRERELRAARLEARLSKARLEVLRSQIQPHFLFNTLHSISALMGTDVAGARKMVADLKALLQLSVESAGEQEVTLAAELEFLDQYISIQRTRFRDRLSLEYAIDPEALDARVPRLVLQPLVENAIRHGLGPRSAPGRIAVRAERVGGVLCLEVEDDGVGTDTPDGRPPREGVGLGNTRARLRSLYGDRQRLDAAGSAEGGFRVRLSIPCVSDRSSGRGSPGERVPPRNGRRGEAADA